MLYDGNAEINDTVIYLNAGVVYNKHYLTNLHTYYRMTYNNQYLLTIAFNLHGNKNLHLQSSSTPRL